MRILSLGFTLCYMFGAYKYCGSCTRKFIASPSSRVEKQQPRGVPHTLEQVQATDELRIQPVLWHSRVCCVGMARHFAAAAAAARSDEFTFCNRGSVWNITQQSSFS